MNCGIALPLMRFQCSLHLRIHGQLFVAVCAFRYLPLRLRLRTSNYSLLLICLSRKDERLSRPVWLTYNGRFTHVSGHPSAAGQTQVRESSPVKDQRSSTVRRNQPILNKASVVYYISVTDCCSLWSVIKYRSVSSDDRVAEVLTWFDGSPKYFPNFGALYFDILDIAGHRFGPYHRMVFYRCVAWISVCLWFSL